MSEANKNWKEAWNFVAIGTVVALVIAWIMHFIGGAIGGFYILNGVFPVNESIWEHMKLGFYPCLLVATLPWCNFIAGFEMKKRLIMASLSAMIAQFFIPCGYYCLRYGWNTEGLAWDIAILVVGIFVGLLHAAMIAKYSFCEWIKWISVVYVICMIIIYYIFAFVPPQFPIFNPPVIG